MEENGREMEKGEELMDLDEQIAEMMRIINNPPPPPFAPPAPPAPFAPPATTSTEKKILGLDGKWRTMSEIRENEQRKYDEAMKAELSGPPRYAPPDPPEGVTPWLDLVLPDGRTNRQAWLNKQSLFNRMSGQNV